MGAFWLTRRLAYLRRILTIDVMNMYYEQLIVRVNLAGCVQFAMLPAPGSEAFSGRQLDWEATWTGSLPLTQTLRSEVSQAGHRLHHYLIERERRETDEMLSQLNCPVAH